MRAGWSALFRGLAAPRGAEETGRGRLGGEVVRFDLFRAAGGNEEVLRQIVFHGPPDLQPERRADACAGDARGRGAERRRPPAGRTRSAGPAGRTPRRRAEQPARTGRSNLKPGSTRCRCRRSPTRRRRCAGPTASSSTWRGEIYPDRWRELTPRLMTVASWVGYDLDGRSDIGWTMTLNKRMRIQHGQIRHLPGGGAPPAGRGRPPRPRTGRADGLGDVLELMESRLALAENQVGSELDVFDRIRSPCAGRARRSWRRCRGGCTKAWGCAWPMPAR